MSNPLRRQIKLECSYILALRPASSQFKHDIIDEAAGKSMTQDVWIGNDCPRLEIPFDSGIRDSLCWHLRAEALFDAWEVCPTLAHRYSGGHACGLHRDFTSSLYPCGVWFCWQALHWGRRTPNGHSEWDGACTEASSSVFWGLRITGNTADAASRFANYNISNAPSLNEF